MRSIMVWGLAALLAMGPHSLWGATCGGEGETRGSPSAPSAEARKAAVEKLEQAGLGAEEARTRLSAMQEQEIAYLAGSEVQIQRGGDAVVTILVVVLLVGLIFYVFGHVERHG